MKSVRVAYSTSGVLPAFARQEDFACFPWHFADAMMAATWIVKNYVMENYFQWEPTE